MTERTLSMFAVLAGALILAGPAEAARDQPAADPVGSNQVGLNRAGTAHAGWASGLARGREGVGALGDALDDLAERAGLTPAQLSRAIVFDGSLAVDENRRLIAFCPPAPAGVERPERVPDPGTIPLDQAFLLNSRPGSAKTVYLDFDGYLSTNNSWGHTIDFPAYNTFGFPTGFSDSERAEIIAQWVQVAEDFAPFDINVTTQDPGLEALRRTLADTRFGVRVVMTQRPDGFADGAGGVAIVGSFNDPLDNPCFAFNKGVLNGAITVSHEVGHTLGLLHDGLDELQYHPGSQGGGDSSWGPIMGAPWWRNISQWSNGDYPGATNPQIDFDVIRSTGNGVTSIADEHQTFPMTRLSLAQPADGLIALPADADPFRFTMPCGGARISVVPLAAGPNVDLVLRVVSRETGALVGEFDPDGTPAIGADIGAPLGEYHAIVSSTHQPLIDGPVSGEGSVGQFTITLEEASACCPADINADGVANPADFTAWLGCFANPAVSPACPRADLDQSGSIDPADFTAWLAAFNAGCD